MERLSTEDLKIRLKDWKDSLSGKSEAGDYAWQNGDITNLAEEVLEYRQIFDKKSVTGMVFYDFLENLRKSGLYNAESNSPTYKIRNPIAWALYETWKKYDKMNPSSRLLVEDETNREELLGGPCRMTTKKEFRRRAGEINEDFDSLFK